MTDPARALLQQGMAYHKAGKLEDARKIYEQILAANPRHADSLHLLGLIEHNMQRYELAEDLVRKAIAEQDNFHIFHNTLGDILKSQSKFSEAVASYEKAMSLRPDFTEPLNNIGASLLSLGNFAEAEKYLQRAITVNSKNINALHNIALLCEGQKKFEQAVQYYQRLLTLNPNVFQAHISLGNLLYLLKKSEAAKISYLNALRFNPDNLDVLKKIANICSDQGQYEDALKYYLQIHAIKPDNTTYVDIALIYQKGGMYTEAISYYKKALELQPDTYEALNNLAMIYKSIGQLDKAIEYLNKAIALVPPERAPYGNLFTTMLYASSVSPEQLAEKAREYGNIITAPLLRSRALKNDKNPDRKLRVGYVSPDFRVHCVSYFVEFLFTLHDKNKFEIYAYANLIEEDAVTRRLKATVDHWRDIRFINDDRVADMIEKDGIDILIDLAGHTAYNNLPVFARKPAPVQATWLGFPATTGIKAIDYRITDGYAEPEGLTEHLNVEKLWRLPEVFCCYQSHENSPAVIDHPPFEDNDYITFGCFNNFSKVSDDALAAWSEILRQVPQSRMLLEIADLHEPLLRADVEKRLQNAKISPERVILEPRKKENQFVLYNTIDIALDPFPCVGGTTSMDTLWMGVPYVTLAGKHFASRMGVSFLTNIGMPELIAQDIDQYIKIAADLANDKRRLKNLRHGLRKRMAASPLMNQEKFVRNMEDAYRAMWKKWCEESSPADLIRQGTQSFYQNNFSEAKRYFEKILNLDPESPLAFCFLAMTMNAMNDFEQGEVLSRQVLQKPAVSSMDDIRVLALNTLGVACKNLGKTDEAIKALREAVQLGFSKDLSYGNLLLAMLYASSISPEDLVNTTREYGKAVADPLIRKRDFKNNLDPDRKLRIGYVSPDFREHPVSYFIRDLFSGKNEDDFEVYAYSCGFYEDDVTQKLKKDVDHWRDIRQLNDDQAADLIERDEIDILVDLAGHTGQNRLLIFARKPAPVQVTWLGYPATTGMKAMDYRITDKYAEPEGATEHLNVETLWRLPDIFCCYQQNVNSPAVIDHPPFEDNGYITFGCFNNFAKVTDDVLVVWSKIINQVENSHLLLEISGIDKPKFRTEVEERLKTFNFPEGRVLLENRKKENQFSLYNKIDIALDPFPCVGGTTSMDALWMGVPFITLAGKHFVSRMGVSILTNAGLPEFIGNSVEEYVSIVTNLANDKVRLKNMRQGLRGRFAASPVMDQRKFTHHMEAAYREMWRLWCKHNKRA